MGALSVYVPLSKTALNRVATQSSWAAMGRWLTAWPGAPATPTIRLWIDRLDWLAGLIDPDPLLGGCPHRITSRFCSGMWAARGIDLERHGGSRITTEDSCYLNRPLIQTKTQEKSRAGPPGRRRS